MQKALLYLVLLCHCAAAAVHAADSGPLRVRNEIDLPLTLGGLAVTATPLLFSKEESVVDRTIHDRQKIFFLDRHVASFSSETIHTIGEGIVLVAPLAASAATLPLYRGRTWSETYTDFLLLAESMVVTSLVNQLVRNSFRRPRPYMYSGDFSRRRDNREDFASFFSGHAASTFAAGTALWRMQSIRYPEHKTTNAIIGAAALTAGLAEATMRVLSGDHFWTDAAVGSAVGVSVGWLVVEAHRSGEPEPGKVTLRGVGPGWVALGMNF